MNDTAQIPSPDEVAAEVVQTILDGALETDYGYESGQEYTSIRYDTAGRIVAALREAGMLRDA